MRVVTGSADGDPRKRMERAAAELLIDEGPDAITHRRVAETAGVPRGSANYFFSTRAALYAAAVRAAEAHRLRSARAFAEAIEPADRGALETAGLLISAWYAPHVGADVVRARLEPMIDAIHEPELRELMSESRPELLDVLREVLARSGYRTDADIDLIALVLDGALLYESHVGSGEELEAARGIVARLLALLPRVAG